MHRNQRRYEIEARPHEIPGLLRSVQENADSQRQALGFLPSQAYEQAARGWRPVRRRGAMPYRGSVRGPYPLRPDIPAGQDISDIRLTGGS